MTESTAVNILSYLAVRKLFESLFNCEHNVLCTKVMKQLIGCGNRASIIVPNVRKLSFSHDGNFSVSRYFLLQIFENRYSYFRQFYNTRFSDNLVLQLNVKPVLFTKLVCNQEFMTISLGNQKILQQKLRITVQEIFLSWDFFNHGVILSTSNTSYSRN